MTRVGIIVLCHPLGVWEIIKKLKHFDTKSKYYPTGNVWNIWNTNVSVDRKMDEMNYYITTLSIYNLLAIYFLKDLLILYTSNSDSFLNEKFYKWNYEKIQIKLL